MLLENKPTFQARCCKTPRARADRSQAFLPSPEMDSRDMYLWGEYLLHIWSCWEAAELQVIHSTEATKFLCGTSAGSRFLQCRGQELSMTEVQWNTAARPEHQPVPQASLELPSRCQWPAGLLTFWLFLWWLHLNHSAQMGKSVKQRTETSDEPFFFQKYASLSFYIKLENSISVGFCLLE